MTLTSGPPTVAPPVLVTSRPLDEYCALFGLTRAALGRLTGPVLDCPGGAAGLAAEARELGCEVVAADPGYALGPHRLAALAAAGRDRMAEAIHREPARHLPARHRRPDKYLRSWDRARRLFAADAVARPERYIAAALPRLPFADGTFALTLSSYLLFAYPAVFAPADQLRALRELVRVTAPGGEVRVYPLHDHLSRPCPHLTELHAALRHHRIAARVLTTDRARRVLVLRRRR
ncbi:class I SAM-dependent methyltransferase [Streptomyces sp. TLI_171]|uniref:class I SAM-dependent methyltransferase n=1 Tax=Streptomyces sp. TLI_171 TaxID=1938859 RepID=UPI000C174401|nr:class I SAM-dependent methyltransferase [Streptomyces sp. TLI_171]RKE20543.1 methyltransferase family protein [Streptomyces sp. TLI_171]